MHYNNYQGGSILPGRKYKMKKQFIGIFLSTILIATIIPINVQADDTFNPLEGGWVEKQDGVTILHVSGTYYEMGYQHGYLLSEKIGISYRAQLSAFERYGYSYNRLYEIWDIMDEYLPNEYKEEMHGMADGSGISFEDICVFCMCPAVFNHMVDDACAEISLWGDATKDGNLYHVRSLDWSLNVFDPDTGTPLYDTTILIVREPIDGYRSLIPEFAGSVGCWHGINEKGIAIGENSCMTYDSTFHGICPWFRMRMVMDYASTSEEALEILISNRTCGTNFILSDANLPIGYALDQSASISYEGTWDDPIEGTSPFWQIKDVVRRVPQYIHPQCSEIEENRIRYDPSGLYGLLCHITRRSSMFIGWTHYKALSNDIEKYYGSLDLHGLMTLLREEYIGNTDFFMKYVSIRGYFQPLYQWVCCPETGEFLISFAENDTFAYYNEIHEFNMFDLMNAESP